MDRSSSAAQTLNRLEAIALKHTKCQYFVREILRLKYKTCKDKSSRQTPFFHYKIETFCYLTQYLIPQATNTEALMDSEGLFPRLR